MAEIMDTVVNEMRETWIERGRPLPLVVSRSGYDDDIVSWEVLFHEAIYCEAPIAEFSTFVEATWWAHSEASKSQATLFDIDLLRSRLREYMPEGHEDCREGQQRHSCSCHTHPHPPCGLCETCPAYDDDFWTPRVEARI